MDALKKLIERKSEKNQLDPKQKEAKMEILKELRDVAQGMMKDDLDGHLSGLKKVTVASDSEEGLKEGLEKAEDIVEAKLPESEDEMDEDEKEISLQPLADRLNEKDPSQMSREELVAELLKLKQKV